MINIKIRNISRLSRPEAFYMAPLSEVKKLSGGYDINRFKIYAEKLRRIEITPHEHNYIPDNRLSPSYEQDFSCIEKDKYQKLWDEGRRILHSNALGAVILAGGTSARLGENKIFTKIHGNKTLLALKIWATLGRARRQRIDIPLFILTSPATKDEVVKIMREEGYKEGKNFMVFDQGMLPILTEDGEMIQYQDKILYSTTGHGSLLSAMQISEALKWMKEKGVQYIVQSNVDNPMVILDENTSNPFLAYLGLHDENKDVMQITAQVTRKAPTYLGGVPLWYKPERGGNMLALIEKFQINPEYLKRFNEHLPYFNPLTLIYNLALLEKFDPGILPEVLIKRDDKDSKTKEVLFSYYKLETMTGSITMFELTTFVPDVIPGVFETGMFAQLKELTQKKGFVNQIIHTFPEFFS